MKDLCRIILPLLCTAAVMRGELIVTSQDFTTPVFPWQPPAVEHRLNGPLRIVGCAGEYEPVTFTVHSGEVQESVTLAIEDLDAFGWDLFWVKSLHRNALGEASFINRLPGIPEDWKNRSPELLMPLAEEQPTLRPGLGQRFYLDCRIPADQPPGRYRGQVVLSSGSTIPLEVEVLPFELVAAPSTYWMWRLTWSDISKPENIACLRDIAAHGYTGLGRKMGASFDFAIQDGRVRVGPGTMPDFARALEVAGLAPQSADDGTAMQLLRLIAKHLELPITDAGQQLPVLEEVLLEKLKRERDMAKAKAESDQMLAGEEPLELALEEPPADPDAELRQQAARQAAVYQKQIAALAIDGFRQVNAIVEDLGLTLFIFPIDEPDGTPWQRRWTTYAAGLAKEAGLETFSTRNNWDWNANIDHNAAGGMINAMYQKPDLAEAPYQGDLAFSPLPWIGAFRGGDSYHFAGLIDEVRIYNRALSAEEIRRQHQRPAPDPLVYLPCDGPMPNAELTGQPDFTDGKVGRALQLNGIDQHLEPHLPGDPVDMSRGWSISLWYKGRGSLFGKGYDFYHQGGQIRYTTTEEDKAWYQYGGHMSDRFWCHLTVSFDPVSQTIRAFCEDSELRRWHRENVSWNYIQVRSFPPQNPRFKTGIMSWWYANHGALRNVTTFCYDWNADHLYVVYPKNGDRFENDGIWYRTLGWEACREGIDDARYLQTLVETLRARDGLSPEAAVAAVDNLLSPVDGTYRSIGRVIDHFGGYEACRRRVIDNILTEQ